MIPSNVKWPKPFLIFDEKKDLKEEINISQGRLLKWVFSLNSLLTRCHQEIYAPWDTHIGN